MTEDMKIAIMAINKWLYYGWNYKVVTHTWNNGTGRMKTKTLPQFLVEAKWTCNLDHMIGKWEDAVQCDNPNAYLNKFYAELDNTNRKILIEWVMKNYNGEMKIINDLL